MTVIARRIPPLSAMLAVAAAVMFATVLLAGLAATLLPPTMFGGQPAWQPVPSWAVTVPVLDPLDGLPSWRCHDDPDCVERLEATP